MKDHWGKVLIESKGLPLGHVGKEYAKELVKAEYGECHKISKLWTDRIRKSIKKLPRMNVYEAIVYCNKLCNMLGNPIIKKVVSYSPDVAEYAGAHYCRNEIHFKHDVWFETLIHELTHHFDNSYGHGKSYCDMLEFLYRIVYEDLTGKNCHDDW